MKPLTGALRSYAWGSPTAIPAILGTQPTGTPIAEYWLGAHEASPALLDEVGLDAAISRDPSVLGEASLEAFGPRLPYLLKILAAIQPLSLQAHPSREQAEAGFAAEEEQGIPLDAPNRIYKDSWPKPEAIVALTEFHGLCGFRDPVRTADLFDQLGVGDALAPIVRPLRARKGSAAIAQVFVDVLSRGNGRDLVATVVAAAAGQANQQTPLGDFARTAVELNESFPGDLGIIAGLLLNRFSLQPGEGLFLPPGNMHAYLRGVGVEIMANSDNVLRGGLTVKHVDVDELLRVVDFTPAACVLMATEPVAPGVVKYATDAPEFALWRVDLADRVPLPGHGARIVLVVEGTADLADGDTTLPLDKGDAAFIVAGEVVDVSGQGTAYVAAAGVSD